MAVPEVSADELAERAKVLFERRIRSQVEKGQEGKYLVIDIGSGDYELDEDDLAASDRLAAKHPEGQFFTMRIGYRALGRIGFQAARRP